MTSHSFNGVPITHCMPTASLTEAVKLIEDTRAASSGRMKALGKAIASGDEAGIKELTHWLVNSQEALLTSAIVANRKLKPAYRQSLETFLRLSLCRCDTNRRITKRRAATCTTIGGNAPVYTRLRTKIASCFWDCNIVFQRSDPTSHVTNV
jgi:hypothetical protein